MSTFHAKRFGIDFTAISRCGLYALGLDPLGQGVRLRVFPTRDKQGGLTRVGVDKETRAEPIGDTQWPLPTLRRRTPGELLVEMTWGGWLLGAILGCGGAYLVLNGGLW